MGVGNSKYQIKENRGIHDSQVNINTNKMDCDTNMCKDFQTDSETGYITFEPKMNKFSIQKKKSKHTRQIFIKQAIHTSLKPLAQYS
jgi:hypothetical protein